MRARKSAVIVSTMTATQPQRNVNKRPNEHTDLHVLDVGVLAASTTDRNWRRLRLRNKRIIVWINGTGHCTLGPLRSDHRAIVAGARAVTWCKTKHLSIIQSIKTAKRRNNAEFDLGAVICIQCRKGHTGQCYVPKTCTNTIRGPFNSLLLSRTDEQPRGSIRF